MYKEKVDYPYEGFAILLEHIHSKYGKTLLDTFIGKILHILTIGEPIEKETLILRILNMYMTRSPSTIILSCINWQGEQVWQDIKVELQDYTIPIQPFNKDEFVKNTLHKPFLKQLIQRRTNNKSILDAILLIHNTLINRLKKCNTATNTED